MGYVERYHDQLIPFAHGLLLWVWQITSMYATCRKLVLTLLMLYVHLQCSNLIGQKLRMQLSLEPRPLPPQHWMYCITSTRRRLVIQYIQRCGGSGLGPTLGTTMVQIISKFEICTMQGHCITQLNISLLSSM